MQTQNYNNSNNKLVEQTPELLRVIFSQEKNTFTCILVSDYFTESTTNVENGCNFSEIIRIASNHSCVEVVDGWQ